MRVVLGFFLAAGVLGACVVGCGGSSFVGDEEPQAGSGGSASGGSSGTGGAGGTGSGGTTMSGGSGGKGSGGSASGGGSSTGGSGVGGGSTGGTGVGGSSPSGGTTAVGGGQAMGGSGAQPGGTGGTGGTAAGAAGAGGATRDHCLLPADSGPCEAAIERWHFDAATGICQPFIYGGCEGNENNFETLEDCSAACAGAGTTDPTACNSPLECIVTAMTCCGGSAMPTLRDVTAINAASYDEFTRPCQLVDCASILGPIPPQIGATCSVGHCVAFDVREMSVTACVDSSQCTLRNGLSCCEACGAQPNGWVAVRADAGLDGLVCGDGPVACDPCVAIPDPSMHASCLENRCEVVVIAPTP